MIGKLITDIYFETWKSMLKLDIQNEFLELQRKELEPYSFTFYTSVSVMSSSKIEGEQLDVDSYVKYKLLNTAYLPELTEKPNDLYNAYLFAKDNLLTKENFHEAHKLITPHLLPESQRGVLRQTEMLVMNHKTGNIQYEAALLSILEEEYKKFWEDINSLLKNKLSIEEVFYYAAFIHLIFVKIHPFADGNGRSARLLEKWFIATMLGERSWYIESEKFYYENVNDYYRNLSKVGMFYEKLDYDKGVDFLLMLTAAIKTK